MMVTNLCWRWRGASGGGVATMYSNNNAKFAGRVTLQHHRMSGVLYGVFTMGVVVPCLYVVCRMIHTS